MGTDFYAQIVIGEKVIKIEDKVTVTKYDEDTGKPYTKKEQQEFWVFEYDNKTKVPGYSDEDYEPENDDLQIYCQGYESDDEEGVYGIQYQSVDNITEIATSEIEELKSIYKKFTGREAKVFLANSYSY